MNTVCKTLIFIYCVQTARVFSLGFKGRSYYLGNNPDNRGLYSEDIRAGRGKREGIIKFFFNDDCN